MDKAKVTPKDFVLWVGAMAALYTGVFAFISLLFDYINTAFPNPIADSYYYGYATPYFGNISYETATLIVLTPVFMLLMRLIRRDIATDPSRNEIWVRRWALFLTLFIAGATMVIDLIVLLTTFLQGEDMTTGFLLKVLVVLLVAGAGFLHFIADMRGYWDRNPERARMINWGVGLLVVVTIVAGFFIIGTPQELRRLKQDDRRVQDLQQIQWQVVNYWQQKEMLPTNLEQLKDPLSGGIIPVDPKTKQPYTYKREDAKSFELCATFEAEGSASNPSIPKPVDMGMNENWQHGIGEVCFDRSIDPERYPPYPKGR
ncbi:hypothetical protein HY970_02445 [Candidatus Kaiserbacteria bacterium]|nr:hypothetical protein [Candidatus Kaiserbacteria bacterium]